MRLSTRARYGARALAELGALPQGRTLSARRVAQSLGISVKYLEQIMGALKAAGFVSAVRGVSGGYMLARAPGEIRLLDVLAALEGQPTLVDCVRDPATCDRSPTCATREVWKRVNDAVCGVLADTTVEDLVEDRARLAQRRTQMYHI